MATSPRKVLIVDDEPDVLRYVQAVLEDDGYQFFTASDGKAALHSACAQLPDLIVLDVQMPVMDGFQTFYELRRDERTKSIPVIMLTGVGRRTGVRFDEKTMGEYLGSEPEAYIEKPIDQQRLLETVRRLIGCEPKP